MNLGSSYFDRIRITPRHTPESIALRICREAEIDIELIRSGPLFGRRKFDLQRRRVRCLVAKSIRNAGYPLETVAAWFVGISPATVRDYLADGASIAEEKSDA